MTPNPTTRSGHPECSAYFVKRHIIVPVDIHASAADYEGPAAPSYKYKGRKLRVRV